MKIDIDIKGEIELEMEMIMEIDMLNSCKILVTIRFIMFIKDLHSLYSPNFYQFLTLYVVIKYI